MHHHLSQNSHIHFFQYSILKNKELKKTCKCQLLQQLEIKSMNARHHHIMTHHSIRNLNGNRRSIFSSFIRRVTAVHLSKESAILKTWNQLPCYSAKSTDLFQCNELGIPPSSLNHINILTVISNSSFNLYGVVWFYLVCCYTYKCLPVSNYLLI